MDGLDISNLSDLLVSKNGFCISGYHRLRKSKYYLTVVIDLFPTNALVEYSLGVIVGKFFIHYSELGVNPFLTSSNVNETFLDLVKQGVVDSVAEFSRTNINNF